MSYDMNFKEKAKKEEEKSRQPVQTKKEVPKIKQSVPKMAKMLQPLESTPKPVLPKPVPTKRAFERALSASDMQPLKKVRFNFKFCFKK